MYYNSFRAGALKALLCPLRQRVGNFGRVCAKLARGAVVKPSTSNEL